MMEHGPVPLDLLRLFGERFINREDTYCLQNTAGRFPRTYGPVTVGLLAHHALGHLTLSLDAQSVRGAGRWLVFDSDAEGLVALWSVAQQLQHWGLAGLVERSRRGGHLWVLFAQPQPAGALKRLGEATQRYLLADKRLAAVMECYPDTEAISQRQQVAHPMRLPFGVHQLTRVVYPFVAATGGPAHQLAVVSGLQWLVGQPQNTQAALRAALTEAERLAPVPPAPAHDLAPRRPLRHGDTLINQVNAGVNLYDVIQATSPAVALRHTRNSASGWCPFHEDEAPQADGTAGTPSLFVVHDARYGWSWRCYSVNCGAYDSAHMHHTFDWFLWSAGGDMAQAFALAQEWREAHP